jgi:hypothetical protein
MGNFYYLMVKLSNVEMREINEVLRQTAYRNEDILHTQRTETSASTGGDYAK